ncbi:hypothetical protein RDI58_013345 [Solanum bulbocastanum]|uniref:Reverse transcriptase/retrotransposon-derived protein RNase H-like domain-containing protein n=1 Tax=Solanum bulbocastanum TaxID=147425 RepID=A0AAN8TKP4_SOLBU
MFLTKKAQAWEKDKDDAVHKIVDISKEVKTLHIPLNSLKILQTNASNEYQSAILLEEKDGQRKICGYARGKFKDVEQHYHSTLKETLVVQKGIKKFNFFLIHIEFLIEVDMRAFPKMIQINQKPETFSRIFKTARTRKNSMLCFCDLRLNMVMICGWKKDI